MPPFFKIFCLIALLVSQFLILVNYVNGANSFSSLQTNLTKKITEEKNKKVNLQSTLGQKINQEIKQNQRQGIVKRTDTIEKISDFKKEENSQKNQTNSQPVNPVLIIR